MGDWFFSHAGNTGGRTIRQISSEIEDGAYKFADPNSILEARLGEGKEWFSPAGSKSGERQLLASYAAALGVKHMVQGHQHNNVRFEDGVERHTGEMFQRWGLLFLTDVGMSREVGDSQGALLKITRTGRRRCARMAGKRLCGTRGAATGSDGPSLARTSRAAGALAEYFERGGASRGNSALRSSRLITCVQGLDASIRGALSSI